MTLKTSHNHEQKSLTSGQTATLQVPTYGRIHSMQLLFLTGAGAPAAEADIRSELSNVRFTINGKDIVNASTIKILDAYEAIGNKVAENGAVAGIVELNFGALFYGDPAVRDVFGLGTNDVTTIQIQVTAGTLVNIASVQAITWRDSEIQRLGAYCSYINYPQSYNAAGEHTVDTLPRDLDTSYLMVLASDGAGGTISHGECKINGNSIMEKTINAANQAFLSNANIKQPAGYFIYNFTDGGINARLPMVGVSDLRFLTTFSVAAGAAGYDMSALVVKNFPST